MDVPTLEVWLTGNEVFTSVFQQETSSENDALKECQDVAAAYVSTLFHFLGYLVCKGMDLLMDYNSSG